MSPLIEVHGAIGLKRESVIADRFISGFQPTDYTASPATDSSILTEATFIVRSRKVSRIELSGNF
jgi:hypothetical protein